MLPVFLRILRMISAAFWTLGAIMLALWIIGRLFNDSWRWSQYIYWIPSAFSILMSGLAAAMALSIQLLVKGWEQLLAGGPPEGRPPIYKREARNPYVLLCLAWGLCGAWSGVFEHRLVADWISRDNGRDRKRISNTILFWNIGGKAREGWVEPLRSIDADLVVVSNQTNWDVVKQFRTLEAPEATPDSGTPAAGEAAPPHPAPAVHPTNNDTTFLAGLFLVHTRLKLREWGLATLNIEQGVGFDIRKANGRYENRDPGYAMYLLFDPEGTVKQGTGQPFVVWLVDFPSDPSLSRQNVTREARRAVDNWKGTATLLSETPDSKGEPQWINVPSEQLGRRGFPVPDVIIGDFNIPRGSRSLNNFVGNMQNAYDQAGVGYTASYPRKVPFTQLDGPGLSSLVRVFIPSDIPFFHIDQAFIAPSLHATRYRVMNLGTGTHWAQFLEIQSR
ncbi:MAG: hypothetical protein U0573_03750 [Phycisphaerales bacterium]|nr:hypothetical protein [Planctomycetota bacterium]